LTSQEAAIIDADREFVYVEDFNRLEI